MKHCLLLVALLLATSALADSPEAILKDYRTRAAQAVERLNQSLEKAATPLITKLVASGDTAGAELLTGQLKDKVAGEPVPTPQASAAPLFAMFDEARAKALAPVQKSSIARIDSLLKTAGGPKLEIVTELGKVREEIEASEFTGAATNSRAISETTSSSSTAIATRVSELVNKFGGKFTQGGDGDKVDINRAQLTVSDLQQICADKRLIDFRWNGGSGLTDEGIAAFEGMKNLDNLYLWSVGSITDAGVQHLAGCEKLRTLNIGANSGAFTGTSFEALAQCKKLESLTLNFLPNVQGANLRHLIRLKSLNHLSLTLCKEVTDADLDWVAQMTNLTYLNLDRTGVTSDGIAKLLPLKHLKELLVSAPLVTPDGVKVLTKVRRDVKVIFAK